MSAKLPVAKKPRVHEECRCLPALTQFPVDLHSVDAAVASLLQTAAASCSKSDADAARRSTFPFLQAEDLAVVQLYSPVYAAAQLFFAQACLAEAEAGSALSTADQAALVAECFRAVDLALLRVGVEMWKGVAAGLLLRAQGMSDRLSCGETDAGAATPPPSLADPVETPRQWAAWLQDVPRVDARELSVDAFLREYMDPALTADAPQPLMFPQPVILQHGMEAWAALSRWRDLEYVKRSAAARLVPVETYDAADSSQTYLTGSWEQQVMSVGDFIDRYVSRSRASGGAGEEAGYLAQYQLFDQVPVLRRDIRHPAHCAARSTEDTEAPLGVEIHSEPLVSAWLGPAGTVSPLHNDPYHNLLCQVVGSKYIRLHSLRETARLYAREGPVCNNSYVDIDNIDEARHPLFKELPGWQCVLRAGEMLYIPRHYWHYVRSLEISFSVSFWFGARMALTRHSSGEYASTY